MYLLTDRQLFHIRMNDILSQRIQARYFLVIKGSEVLIKSSFFSHLDLTEGRC